MSKLFEDFGFVKIFIDCIQIIKDKLLDFNQQGVFFSNNKSQYIMKVLIVVNVLFFYFGYVSEVNIVEYFYFLDYFVLVDLIFVDIED